MTRVGYRVRDKVTKKLWNGDRRWSKFGDTGKMWPNRKAAEDAIEYFFRYSKSFNVKDMRCMPEKWEIVEVELQETEKAVHNISDFLEYSLVREEVNQRHRGLNWFMDTMRKRGVHNDIEFIFVLKPREGTRYVDSERIKEARAHLRQLGVKTRTFRENNGSFGMLNREQAMRARLTLDVQEVIDLAEIRTKVREALTAPLN